MPGGDEVGVNDDHKGRLRVALEWIGFTLGTGGLCTAGAYWIGKGMVCVVATPGSGFIIGAIAGGIIGWRRRVNEREQCAQEQPVQQRAQQEPVDLEVGDDQGGVQTYTVTDKEEIQRLMGQMEEMRAELLDKDRTIAQQDRIIAQQAETIQTLRTEIENIRALLAKTEAKQEREIAELRKEAKQFNEAQLEKIEELKNLITGHAPQPLHPR